ncbi:hypothetical protein Tamer19_54610 [Cupriavidus sp. TA19]|uniref:amidohydrolase family protein n=1 Tax=unclassified Cupriavidus TaxID=2640874 RepID=UPI000E2EE6A8|nr:amidohydrolase family protein [Cupriavidus sp. TA19]BDB29956.1 hypothetical protein CTP10_R73720 [Cupriavidus sp. P-10]GLC96052.1 hypothetical protein Tamer19_54610 [Cupriavidus sp. TA19]
MHVYHSRYPVASGRSCGRPMPWPQLDCQAPTWIPQQAHPTEKQKPADAVLFDLLKRWAPDEKVRRQILVDNPTRLYQFS